MKKKTIEFFKLKRKKHSIFGTVYEYVFNKRDWVKNETALMYTFIEIERWAKKMQEIIEKETYD